MESESATNGYTAHDDMVLTQTVDTFLFHARDGVSHTIDSASEDATGPCHGELQR